MAGIVAALAWPHLWARFGGPETEGSVELIIATLVVIALPAHFLVVGVGQSNQPSGGKLDTALLKRVAAWLGGAAGTLALRGLASL